jgi:tetratricopeptide (TPR) repeat protein
MPWSYRKSVKIGPFRLNASKSGLGVSVGVKGARVSVNKRGTYFHGSIPGTGLRYSEKLSGPSRQQDDSRPQLEYSGSTDRPSRVGQGIFVAIILLITVGIAGSLGSDNALAAGVVVVIGLLCVYYAGRPPRLPDVSNEPLEPMFYGQPAASKPPAMTYVNPYEAFQRGSDRLRSRDYLGAIISYTKAIEAFSEASWRAIAYTMRGQAHEGNMDTDKAFGDYNSALLMATQYPDAYWFRGQIFARRQAWEPAIDDFTKAITLNAGGFGAYLQRGICYHAIGDKTAAANDYSVVIRSRSNEAMNIKALAYKNRADLYVDVGQNTNAANDYEKYLGIEPGAEDYDQIMNLIVSLRTRSGSRRKTPSQEPQAKVQATKLPHEVLGVAPGASQEEIATAYRKLVQQYHPDKVAHLAPEYQEIATRRMKEINAAYTTMKKT